ncbi:MAG: hypothetical protein K2Q20_03085 [Phycisphaerales bacterium]|nr:hypothetical protein [Phycisphaerales bacterium]
MDAKAIRTFVSEHPKVGRLATSFWLHDPERDETRLVNAMLVKEILPLPETGKKKRKGHAA